MELCIPKCEVTGYDFGKGEECRDVDTVVYNGRRLKPLAHGEAFRPGGIWAYGQR
jgi:hypothetical protein